jgi:hypothetical protein
MTEKRAAIRVGEAIVVEAEAPDGTVGAVFEDDGSTGYFYAVDYRGNELKILDAVHIYTVTGVLDHHRMSYLVIRWDDASENVTLFVNDKAHAVFDFKGRRGFCVDGFPAAPARSGWTRHVLDGPVDAPSFH